MSALWGRLHTKWPLLVMYVMLTVAGVVSLARPSPVVYSLIPPWVTVAWAAFFALGGACSAVGVLRGDWAGEVIGLPLACSACALYSAALFVQASAYPERVSGAAWFVGLLVAAYAAGLGERWRNTWSLLRMSRSRPVGGDE